MHLNNGYSSDTCNHYHHSGCHIVAKRFLLQPFYLYNVFLWHNNRMQHMNMESVHASHPKLPIVQFD